MCITMVIIGHFSKKPLKIGYFCHFQTEEPWFLNNVNLVVKLETDEDIIWRNNCFGSCFSLVSNIIKLYHLTKKKGKEIGSAW